MFDSRTFDDMICGGVLSIGDGYRAKLDELGGNGPFFLRAGALTDNGFEWKGLDAFRKDFGSGIKVKMGFGDDVVITTKGNSIGRVGFVPMDAPAFCLLTTLELLEIIKARHSEGALLVLLVQERVLLAPTSGTRFRHRHGALLKPRRSAPAPHPSAWSCSAAGDCGRAGGARR